jgi:CheY-like chemotaxis protein
MTRLEGRAILVVEDDPAIRDMVGEALRDEGYEVVEAPDGGAAITALRERRPTPDALCLMILDMMLPVADGVEVLRALADLGSYVPVLAVSADRGQLRRAAEAGADATLPKPFDLDRLLAVAERNCAR